MRTVAKVDIFFDQTNNTKFVINLWDSTTSFHNNNNIFCVRSTLADSFHVCLQIEND